MENHKIPKEQYPNIFRKQIIYSFFENKLAWVSPAIPISAKKFNILMVSNKIHN